MRRGASKYRAISEVVDGIRFHSRKEANRYRELKLLEKAGEIRNLELQPKFALSVRGVRIGEYRGDFRFEERVDGHWLPVCEDVKSTVTKTAIYCWKKKHVLAEHGVEIREV